MLAAWYTQGTQNGETLGPFTVPELCVKWRKDDIDGLTRVWRSGLDGWRALGEVPDLKETLQSHAGSSGSAEASDRPCKRGRRPTLDEVPLQHTYTSQEGVLFVFDKVDDDWKVSDVYEALVAEEKAMEEEPKEKRLKDGKEIAEGTPGSQTGADKKEHGSTSNPEAAEKKEGEAEGAAPSAETALLEEAEEFVQECLADVSTIFAGGAPSLRASRAAVAAAAAAAAAGAGQAGLKGAKGATVANTTPGEAGPEAPMSEEKQAKALKRKEYRERKKLKKQAGLFVKAQENPNVYISGLPPDVTVLEIEQVAKRAGVLGVDPETGDAKIRIYTDDRGQCRGDALVTYANVASVELAVKFLHEHEFRPKCLIAVQQADFKDVEQPKLSKEELLAAAANRRRNGKDRAKFIAAKNLEKEAVSWSGEMDDGTGRRTVVLKHMFSAEEAETEGPEFYVELAEEVREECDRIGQVVKVKPLERHRMGIVCVKFKTSGAAEECIRVMDGRYFAGRIVEASFHDGRTDLMALGVARPAPVQQPPPTNNNSGGGGAAETGAEEQTTAAASEAVTEEQPGPIASNETAAAAEAQAAAIKEVTSQRTFEEELDDQSSGSDSELRVRVEE